ncbi:hypothetical protein ACIA8F_19790 [Streptomyces sp. NPDC051563]|uniref:hypothetical protein n=1 Tax=Streptomyces sp. NPDC051563 TaxID=3365659 RepID=UPI0037B63ED4
MVRYRARLALVRDDLLPAAARDANLRMTAEALEAAGIAYGLVPDGGPAHRVVIAPGGRSAVLEACAAAFAGRAVYARLLGDGELGDVLAERLPHAVATTETDPQAKVKGICLFNAS